MTSRVQKLRGKDGSLLDEGKVRPMDEMRTVEVREFGAATARRQYHWDTRRTSLSIPPVRQESEVREGQAQRYVCFTLPTALGNKHISKLQHMSKTDTLTFSSRCWGSLPQAYLDDFTQGNHIPRLVSTPGVHIPVYLSSHRVPRYRSSTDVSCL